MIVGERNETDVSVVDNVTVKKKPKRREVTVDIDDDSRRVQPIRGDSGIQYPVWMVVCSHKSFTFTV